MLAKDNTPLMINPCTIFVYFLTNSLFRMQNLMKSLENNYHLRMHSYREHSGM